MNQDMNPSDAELTNEFYRQASTLACQHDAFVAGARYAEQRRQQPASVPAKLTLVPDSKVAEWAEEYNKLPFTPSRFSRVDFLMAKAAAYGREQAQQSTKELAYGNRGDYYLMANARRICSSIMSRSENWVLAAELFATGSNSAIQICRDAGIDPYSTKVARQEKALIASQGGA